MESMIRRKTKGKWWRLGLAGWPGSYRDCLGELGWIHTMVIAARHYSDSPSRPAQVRGRFAFCTCCPPCGSGFQTRRETIQNDAGILIYKEDRR